MQLEFEIFLWFSFSKITLKNSRLIIALFFFLKFERLRHACADLNDEPFCSSYLWDLKSHCFADGGWNSTGVFMEENTCSFCWFVSYFRTWIPFLKWWKLNLDARTLDTAMNWIIWFFFIFKYNTKKNTNDALIIFPFYLLGFLKKLITKEKQLVMIIIKHQFVQFILEKK